MWVLEYLTLQVVALTYSGRRLDLHIHVVCAAFFVRKQETRNERQSCLHFSYPRTPYRYISQGLVVRLLTTSYLRIHVFYAPGWGG
jgi:hypothetical protein